MGSMQPASLRCVFERPAQVAAALPPPPRLQIALHRTGVVRQAPQLHEGEDEDDEDGDEDEGATLGELAGWRQRRALSTLCAHFRPKPLGADTKAGSIC